MTIFSHFHRSAAIPRFVLPICVVCILFAPALRAQIAQKSTSSTLNKPSAPSQASSPESSAETPSVLVQLNNALETLAARVSPAVVQILVTGFGSLKEEDRSQAAFIVRQHAVGSGVIVDSHGYIMTNAHVVEGAERIRVALPLPRGDSTGAVPLGKRRIFDARLLGFHKETDLALLKIEETDLPTLSLMSPERPQVGQLVFAIGSPEGLQNSVTMGVLSALARQPDPAKAMTYLQTDAPINPGNSGGPLVDMNGAVIGINTFILSEGGGSEGLGFAIPARVVDFVYHSLRNHGHVHRVEIGAAAQEITPDLAEGLQLAQKWGVLVADVVPEGPAASAGLQVQDIIISADDRRIETLPAFTSALYLHRLDEAVKLVVLRGNERKTLFVPAIEHRDHVDELLDAINHESSLIPRLGIIGVDLNADLLSQLSPRIPSGVVVLGRAADLFLPDTGLQAGDVIHQLNTTPIRSMDTLRSAVQPLKPGDPVVLQVERADGLTYVSFEME
jgi:serine protease Do